MSNLVLSYAHESCQKWTGHSEVEAVHQGNSSIPTQQEIRRFFSVPFGEIFEDAFQNLSKGLATPRR